LKLEFLAKKKASCFETYIFETADSQSF